MRHLDLFAGIGGFSRAVQWLGGQTVAFVEWEAWNRRVLAKHWPSAKFYGDIKSVSIDDLRSLGRIDLITGGYPCQPFSLAGRRRGHEDDRHLWPEMRRVIDATRPTYILAENVAGHITMGLDTVLTDLEADGYTARTVVVPAGAVNALHRRDRVWIMGHANGDGERESQPQGRVSDKWGWSGDVCETEPMAHADQQRPERPECPEQDGVTWRARVGLTKRHAGCAQRDTVATMADAKCWGRREHLRVDSERESLPSALRTEGASGTRSGGIAGGNGEHESSNKTLRGVDTLFDGLSTRLVRRPAAGSDRPDLIRAAWADGSWEYDLPRVVTDEPERRQKLMAAGNAIVPLVAYEILRVMLEVA